MGDDISSAEAARRVGAAMYGDEWIGDLTNREKYLITRYVEGYPRVRVVKIVVRGREWVEYPSEPTLMAEVERARDRRDWREYQLGEAYDWLDGHGFRYQPVIDSDALTREMNRSFSPVSGPPATANKGGRRRGRPPAVDWSVVETEVLRLMDENGNFGADSPEWNARARLEEAIESFCESKFMARPARSTIQEHIEPWLIQWEAKRRSPEN
jgi:hypothetical protein